MEETTVYDYASPVQRVLMEPNVLFGIGIMPAMFILVLTIILMNIVSFWTIIIGIGLFLAAKTVCKKDNYMLEILIERLMVSGSWRS